MRISCNFVTTVGLTNDERCLIFVWLNGSVVSALGIRAQAIEPHSMLTQLEGVSVSWPGWYRRWYAQTESIHDGGVDGVGAARVPVAAARVEDDVALPGHDHRHRVRVVLEQVLVAMATALDRRPRYRIVAREMDRHAASPAVT